MADQKHICGKCQGEFGSEQEYVEHLCKVTGVQPTNPEHLGPEFQAISQAALARGAARKAKE